MKKWLIAALFGSALVLGACGNDNADDNNGAATNDNAGETGGETASAADDLFQANCAACHGADLSGGAGADLRKIGSTLSTDEIKNTILNGKGSGMPAFKDRLSDDEVQQLADWLSEKK